MSERKTGNSIGIGGIIFWGVVIYNIFGPSDKKVDDQKVNTIENNKPSISDKINNKIDDIKPKINKAIKKAKEEFEEAKKEEELKKEDLSKENNIFSHEDVYGDGENRW